MRGGKGEVKRENDSFSRGSPSIVTRSFRRAFTLIELLVVCAIMMVVVGTIAVPLFRYWKGQDMRKSVRDLLEICGHARAQAILKGQTVTVVFHPRDGKMEIRGGGGGGDAAPNIDIVGVAPGASKINSVQLAEDIGFEMLDINQYEYNEAETALVHFFSNGRSYEMTAILLSSKNERKVITLEPMTGLAAVDDFDVWRQKQQR